MNCPACNEPLVVLEHESIEVDYCVACHGVWLDAGELELLFGERAMTEGFLTAGDATKARNEARRRCPICGKKMEKQVTGGEHPVIYDRCPQGDGIWFDKGELNTVLTHGSPVPGGNAVSTWLQDTFGAQPKPPDKPQTNE